MPSMSSDSALLASVVIALLAIVVGARTVLAWQGLASRAAAARRRRQRMERLEAGVHTELSELRARAQRLNAHAERALWSLTRLDSRLDAARVTLADDRALLEQLTHDDAAQMRATFRGIRGTLNALRSVREIRRTILG